MCRSGFRAIHKGVELFVIQTESGQERRQTWNNAMVNSGKFGYACKHMKRRITFSDETREVLDHLSELSTIRARCA
jgi:hypothetical protein